MDQIAIAIAKVLAIIAALVALRYIIQVMGRVYVGNERRDSQVIRRREPLRWGRGLLVVSVCGIMVVPIIVQEFYSEELGDIISSIMVIVLLLGEIGDYLQYHFIAIPRSGGLILEIPYTKRVTYDYYKLIGVFGLWGIGMLLLRESESGSIEEAILLLFTAAFFLHQYLSPVQLRENGILTVWEKLIPWKQIES